VREFPIDALLDWINFTSMSTAQIKELALSLPDQERADLAQALWESLDASFFPVSEEFLAELERRDQKISSGEVSCHTHEEVMAKAKRVLGC
jgi:putative addiction module component (TIGR02574 family)